MKLLSTPNKSKFYLPDFAMVGIVTNAERCLGFGGIGGFEFLTPVRIEVERVSLSLEVGVEFCTKMEYFQL